MKFQGAFRLGLATVVGIAVSLLSAPRAQAATIYACVNKNTGAVRIVSATTVCDAKKETSLTWTAGPPSPALRVVDSNGQTVGIYVTEGVTAGLVNGSWANFATSLTSFGTPGGSVTLLYESADCSGTAYTINLGTLLPYTFEAGATVYYTLGPQQTVTFQSNKFWDDGASAFSSCIPNSPTTRSDLGQALQAPMPGPFTSPFRVTE